MRAHHRVQGGALFGKAPSTQPRRVAHEGISTKCKMALACEGSSMQRNVGSTSGGCRAAHVWPLRCLT